MVTISQSGYPLSIDEFTVLCSFRTVTHCVANWLWSQYYITHRGVFDTATNCRLKYIRWLDPFYLKHFAFTELFASRNDLVAQCVSKHLFVTSFYIELVYIFFYPAMGLFFQTESWYWFKGSQIVWIDSRKLSWIKLQKAIVGWLNFGLNWIELRVGVGIGSVYYFPTGYFYSKWHRRRS